MGSPVPFPTTNFGLLIPDQSNSYQQSGDMLRTYVQIRAQMAGSAFAPVLERFRDAALAMQCKYSPQQLTTYKGDAIYLGIINAKCRTAAAWILDILSNHTAKPWTLSASPVTELPQEMQGIVMERLMAEAMAMGIDPSMLASARDKLVDLAKAHANRVAGESIKRMETFIEDMLTESGWAKEFEAFVHDLVLYPYAAMITPVAEPRRRLKHKLGASGVTVQDDIVLAARRLSPWSVIPAPNAQDPHSCEYITIHDSMTPDELMAAKSMQGFDPRAIDVALERGIPSYTSAAGSGQHASMEPPYLRLIREIEQGGAMYGDVGQGFRRMRYFGRVPNRLLAEREVGGMNWRVMDSPSLLEGVSECEIWIVNGVMVRAIVITDFLGKRPIHIASFVTVPGSMIGRGLSDELMPYQKMVNALARAMVRNYGYASGPILEQNVGKMASGSDPISEIAPYRVYHSDPDPIAGDNGPMLTVYNIPSLAAELMGVLETYMKLADTHSGIPAFALGQGEMSGVARTASGLSMLITNAAKSIKLVFRNIDRSVADMIGMVVDWVLLYHPDPSMKAEVSVITHGATGLLQRELQQAKTFELLQLLQPYIQMGILPPDTLLMILRRVVESQGFDPDSLRIPDPERQAQVAVAAQANAQAAPRPQQPDMPMNDRASPSLPSQDGRFVPNPMGAQPIPA